MDSKSNKIVEGDMGLFIGVVLVAYLILACVAHLIKVNTEPTTTAGGSGPTTGQASFVQYIQEPRPYTREDLMSVANNLKDVRSILNSIWFVLILLILLYLGESLASYSIRNQII
ncbi:hypothetical protein DFH27DRAFT_528995 [Peziza echinospora]|nr:hypothetical protein DFH27DRAFT_528995 [Peziza echinospora]